MTPKKHDGTLNFGEGTLNFSEWDAVAPVSAPHRILQIPGFQPRHAERLFVRVLGQGPPPPMRP